MEPNKLIKKQKSENLKNTVLTIFRYIVYIFIIHSIYKETGYYTSVGILILFIQFEYIGYVVIKIMNSMKDMLNVLR
jgi:hypothetical protein